MGDCLGLHRGTQERAKEKTEKKEEEEESVEASPTETWWVPRREVAPSRAGYSLA